MLAINNLNIKYLLVKGDIEGNDEQTAERYYYLKGFSILRHPFKSKKHRNILSKFFGKDLITRLSKKNNGSPDLFIYKELNNNKLRYCFIECKSDNFNLSKNQFLFLKKLQENKLKFLVFKIMKSNYK